MKTRERRKGNLGLIFGLVLLMTAMAFLCVSLYKLSLVRPASAYEDMGVYTFVPDKVYSKQVKQNKTKRMANGKTRRRTTTTTVYFVTYRTQDGNDYRYDYKTGSLKSEAQQIVETGKPIERRVLSIRDEGGYITIDANQTAQSYEAQQKRTYGTIAGVSAAYLLIWVVGNVIIFCKRRRRRESDLPLA